MECLGSMAYTEKLFELLYTFLEDKEPEDNSKLSLNKIINMVNLNNLEMFSNL